MNESRYTLRTPSVIMEALPGHSPALDRYAIGLQQETLREKVLENRKVELALELIAAGDADDALPLHRVTRPEPTGSGPPDNCPLIAILTAMTHVPQMRAVIEFGGVVREREGKFSTYRIRQSYEYPFGTEPAVMPRLPGASANSEGGRFFSVTFYQGPRQSSIGPGQAVHTRFGGHTVTRLVSPVFYIWAGASLPPRLFYAHSTTRALYPSAIEKAYVYLKSGSGRANYQVINDGLTVAEVMFELAGYARMGLIAQIPGENFDLLPNSLWKSWLKQHAARPTVLASKANPGNPGLIVGNHAYPVIVHSEKAKTITVVNVLKEVAEATSGW